jgi:hypothetical protein
MRIRALLLVLSILAAIMTRQVTPERAVFGHWSVTGWSCPVQGCALAPAQASAFRGRRAFYSDSLVRIGGTVCRGPRYNVDYWPATGLYGGSRLKDFGIRADSALVVEVGCAPQVHSKLDPRWQVWGAFVIIKDSEHLLVVWEGVFFELTLAHGAA